MRHVPLLGLAALLAAPGCTNACGRICKQMADYAEECGLTVTDAELDECLEAQAGKESRDDRAACREYNDPEVIRQEWSCDDLEDYWAGEADDEEGDTGDTQD